MSSGLISHFNLQASTVREFILLVSSHYKPVTYHNFEHAVYILQGVFLLLMTEKFEKFFEPIDKLALLIAALCHDVEHDGRTNSYHVNA